MGDNVQSHKRPVIEWHLPTWNEVSWRRDVKLRRPIQQRVQVTATSLPLRTSITALGFGFGFMYIWQTWKSGGTTCLLRVLTPVVSIKTYLKSIHTFEHITDQFNSRISVEYFPFYYVCVQYCKCWEHKTSCRKQLIMTDFFANFVNTSLMLVVFR